MTSLRCQIRWESLSTETSNTNNNYTFWSQVIRALMSNKIDLSDEMLHNDYSTQSIGEGFPKEVNIWS